MSQQTIVTVTLDDAKRRLYDAETALHAAHTSHVDEWISAAADRLHEALEVYLAAVTATEAG
jgi:hypothetical protein